MDELKSCPFCGGKAEIDESLYTFVRCENCKAESGVFLHKYEAIRAWNRRVNDDRK